MLYNNKTLFNHNTMEEIAKKHIATVAKVLGNKITVTCSNVLGNLDIT